MRVPDHPGEFAFEDTVEQPDHTLFFDFHDFLPTVLKPMTGQRQTAKSLPSGISSRRPRVAFAKKASFRAP
jgi:hypothetical protein